MSNLAQQLATVEPTTRVRKGPIGTCFGVYPADLEDFEQVERLRTAHNLTWREVQEQVDTALGVDMPRINGDKFRYHWRRKCSCWPVELRDL